MQKLNDLSRSLTRLDPDGTLIAVIEMSQSSWLVAGIVPGVERQPLKKLAVGKSRSLRLEAKLFDDRPPLVGVGSLQGGKRFRCLLLGRKSLIPEFGEPRSHCRIGQCLYGRRTELADNIFRRALGAKTPNRKSRAPVENDANDRRRLPYSQCCLNHFSSDVHEPSASLFRRPIENLPGTRGRHCVVFEHDLAIDDDKRYPLRYRWGLS